MVSSQYNATAGLHLTHVRMTPDFLNNVRFGQTHSEKEGLANPR